MHRVQNRLRFALLLGTAITCLQAFEGRAQAPDGTWIGPSNENYPFFGNWSSGARPTGTATFLDEVTPRTINLTILGTVGGWNFMGNTTPFTFNDVNGTFNGAGINAGTAPQPVLNVGGLRFSGTASMGNAIINVNSGGGLLDFLTMRPAAPARST